MGLGLDWRERGKGDEIVTAPSVPISPRLAGLSCLVRLDR